jgi:uncharacterized protein (DUF1501 family)
MSKTCDGCKNKSYTEEEKIMTVPYIAHQSAVARQERQMRRMWIVILVLIGALIGTNLAWIIYNSQFEVVEESITVEQENDDGDNNYIGNDGDITYGEAENND